jgi:spermidine synthase
MTQSLTLATVSRAAPNSLHGLFAIAFTLSGFAALAYQIAWQRVLTQVIGSDAISVVLIVSIFMIWFGVGAEIARRLLPLVGTLAGLAYAVLETAIGLAGIVSIPLMRAANALLAEVGGGSLLADVLLNLLLLAVPVIGMGMTAPLIVEVAKNQLADLGRTVGRFYGLNILGAAVGALLTGLVLIELLGLFGVTLFAAFLNVSIGISVLVALRGHAGDLADAPDAETGSVSAKPNRSDGGHLLAYGLAAVLFGFGTLALQIIYFRVLSNYFTLSVIVFPAVLCAYLILMSAGQVIGGWLADRHPQRLEPVIAALFGAGALLLLAALRFPPAWAARLGALAFTDFNGQLIRDLYPRLIGDPSPIVVRGVHAGCAGMGRSVPGHAAARHARHPRGRREVCGALFALHDRQRVGRVRHRLVRLRVVRHGRRGSSDSGRYRGRRAGDLASRGTVGAPASRARRTGAGCSRPSNDARELL